jgi:hypothetical protein
MVSKITLDYGLELALSGTNNAPVNGSIRKQSITLIYDGVTERSTANLVVQRLSVSSVQPSCSAIAARTDQDSNSKRNAIAKATQASIASLDAATNSSTANTTRI